jgi:hypothetical protein
LIKLYWGMGLMNSCWTLSGKDHYVNGQGKAFSGPLRRVLFSVITTDRTTTGLPKAEAEPAGHQAADAPGNLLRRFPHPGPQKPLTSGWVGDKVSIWQAQGISYNLKIVRYTLYIFYLIRCCLTRCCLSVLTNPEPNFPWLWRTRKNTADKA